MVDGYMISAPSCFVKYIPARGSPHAGIASESSAAQVADAAGLGVMTWIALGTIWISTGV